MPEFKKIISILFRIGISVILLIFLFRGIDKKSLFELIKNSNKPLLFYSFMTVFIMYPLAVIRWNMLLKAAKIHLPLKRVITSFSGSLFFNLFLPSTIGGDFMRSIDLASHTKKTKEVIATVLLDRLSGYIGLVSVSLLAVFLGFKLIQDKLVFIPILIITLILSLILYVLFNRRMYSKITKLLQSSEHNKLNSRRPAFSKIRESLSNLHHEIICFRNHKRMIYNNLILSLMIQLFTPLSFYLLGLALGIKINITYFFVFLPIITAITLLPISIGGLGLRDATTIYFFAKAGVIKNSAFAMSLLNFSFVLILGGIGGLIYAFALHNRRV